VVITARVDLGCTIMIILGYLTAPAEVIFKALEHNMRYLYVYRHMPIFYPHHPLSKKAHVVYLAKGSDELLYPEYGTMLGN
jgi:hypothetical protein